MKSIRLKCAQCGVRFKPPTRGRPPRFCSASCRQAAYFERRIRVQREPFALLSQYLSHVQVRGAIRQELWLILRQIGAIDYSTPIPDPKDPPRDVVLDHLRRSGLDAGSVKQSIQHLTDDERNRLRDPPDED